MPSETDIRTMDGAGLTRLAHELGLAPKGVVNLVRSEARIHYGLRKPDSLAVASWWEPDTDVAQADAVFRSLRARGYTTSCVWFNDDRQYGEAWLSLGGRRAYSVRWTREDGTEALALLRVSVLAVTREAQLV